MSFDHTIKAGTTSKIIEFMMRDSATGQGKTGLNSSNTTCYYVREGVTGGSAVTLNTGIGGGYFSGAFYPITSMNGMYHFSIPNAALASGAEAVTLLFTSSGAIDKQIRICLLAVDLYDATDMGVTNLANTSPTVQQIVDGVWDELSSAHTSVGSFGYYLDDQVSGATAPTASEVSNAVWTQNLATHSGNAGSTAEALSNAVAPTVQQIVDGVWDEQIVTGGHTTVGTFGHKLYGLPEEDEVADAVWDELLSGGHNITNSAAEYLRNATGATAAEVADAVWDELQADHVVAGSFGEVATEIASILVDTNDLQTNQGNWLTATGFSTHSAADVADAVWDELQADHTTAGTFGVYLDSAVSGATAPTEAEIYTYFAASTRPDVFKADVSSLATSSEIAALNDPTEAEIYTYFTSVSRQDAFKADVATLGSAVAVVDSNVDAIKAKTDQLTFTVAGQLDANALTTAAPTEAEIYAHFTLGSNEDVFKTDISGLPSAASIADAVWDENVVGHTLAGSFGEHLFTRPSSSAIADSVWDEVILGHNISGTFGEALSVAPTAAEIYAEFTTGSNEDAFKADVSGLATASSITSVASQITGLNDPTEAEIYTYFTAAGRQDTFKADVSGLATTLDVTSNVPSEAEIYSYFTNTTRPDAFKANVSGLSTFDPAVDIVANVNAVATVTGDVNTNAASRIASQTDISSLATAASIAALNDVSAADVYAEFTNLGNEDVFKADLSTLNDISAAEVYNYFATPINAAAFKADVTALASQASVNTIDANVDAIKVKTDQMAFTTPNQLDVNVVAGGGDDAATIYTYFTSGSNEDAFKANVASLASQSDVTDIKSKTDQLAFTVGGQVDANALTTVAPSVGDIYTYLVDPSRVDAFKADVSSVGIDAAGVASAVWDANVTSHVAAGTYGQRVLRSSSHNATLQVTGSQHIAADIHETQDGVITAASTSADFVDEIQNGLSTFDHAVDAVITDTASREASKADISALASQASVDALNDLSGSEVAGSVWNALSASYTLSGSFGEFLDGNVSNAGGTGNGLYRVDVLVQDASLAAVPNARISVDGTSYELTTKSDGIATFMLDSGIYTLRCAPPEGYDVPADNVVTIVSSDIANTFTVNDTATPPSSSDVPWIG